MVDHSDAVATVARQTVASSLIRKQRQVVRSVSRKDLQVGSMPRTNVLVVGNPDATRIVLDMLRLDLRGPVVTWRAGQPLSLPVPEQAATLVLENVTRLSNDDQFRVLRWLDDVKSKVRIVSTTNVPIWPRVQAGVFNEVLYYRLNTVFVDMGTA